MLPQASGDELPAVETYMAQHRAFSEPLTSLVRSVLNEPVSRDHVTDYQARLEAVTQETGETQPPPRDRLPGPAGGRHTGDR